MWSWSAAPHLQDATPLTLGQLISGWAAQIDQALDAIRWALPGVLCTSNRGHGRWHRAQWLILALRSSGAADRGRKIVSPSSQLPTICSALGTRRPW